MSDFGCAVAFVIFTGLFSGLIWFNVGQHAARSEAIKASVGHWEINPKTGEETFVYDCPNCNNEDHKN